MSCYFLKEKLDFIQEFNVVSGFLNFIITDEYWVNCLHEINENPTFGYAEKDSKPTVMVEYSSPNTNNQQTTNKKQQRTINNQKQQLTSNSHQLTINLLQPRIENDDNQQPLCSNEQPNNIQQPTVVCSMCHFGK